MPNTPSYVLWLYTSRIVAIPRANEQWQAFGVEEFPDLAALQTHTQLLNELNWYRYIESSTTLGTAYEEPSA